MFHNKTRRAKRARNFFKFYTPFASFKCFFTIEFFFTSLKSGGARPPLAPPVPTAMWNAKTYTGEILIWRHIDGVVSEKPQNTHNLTSYFLMVALVQNSKIAGMTVQSLQRHINWLNWESKFIWEFHVKRKWIY